MEIKKLADWPLKIQGPLVIAGPCSAETEEQVLETAKKIKSLGNVQAYRAGIWKPRTRPNTFEGIGLKGLGWLAKAKEETGLPITTEVANASHVEEALKHNVDILWIGARTTVSPFAVQEIADALKGVKIPVMIKNPINADLALWVGAIERVLQSGNDMVAAIHRGFSSYEPQKYRNVPLWKIPVELKQKLPGIPTICDPSHIAGDRSMILEVCQKAMDLDMDGLMVETHRDPNVAWSDAKQQVTPQALGELLQELDYKSEFSEDQSFEAEMEKLRRKIDRVDREILDSLKLRLDIVKDIATTKIKNHVTAMQKKRLEEMMLEREKWAQEIGLSPKFVEEVFNDIHAESVTVQTELMKNEGK
jgi:chorismate mutase